MKDNDILERWGKFLEQEQTFFFIINQKKKKHNMYAIYVNIAEKVPMWKVSDIGKRKKIVCLKNKWHRNFQIEHNKSENNTVQTKCY